MERQGVTHSSSLAVRRHYINVPQFFHRRGQCVQAWRGHPVVIGHENRHSGIRNKKSCAWQLFITAPVHQHAAIRCSCLPPQNRGSCPHRLRTRNSHPPQRSTPSLVVGASRFERPTTRTPSECATRLRHAPTVPSFPSKPCPTLMTTGMRPRFNSGRTQGFSERLAGLPSSAWPVRVGASACSHAVPSEPRNA